jgi:signal transduction histidine kinase
MVENSINKQASSTTRFASGVWKMHLIIFGIGLLMVCFVGYGFYFGNRINTVDASLVRAAMKIKLEASTTNLVIEGLLGDGFVADFEPIWEPLDAAFLDFRSIFHASKKRKIVLPFLVNAVDLGDIENISSKLSIFKEKAGERFTNKRISFIDEEVDKVYRAAFKDLLEQLDDLENKLQGSMSKNLRLFGYSQAAVLILCILLTILAALIFQRFEGARLKAYFSLQKANVQLEKEIRERERTEKALRASEERFRQLAEELRQFSSAVSHDLRAPLINLKGFSKEITAALDMTRPIIDSALSSTADENKKKLSTAFYQDIPEALKHINLAISKMDRLVTALLKLSRLGRRELLPEKLDMNKMVQDTLKSFAYQIKEEGVNVSVDNLPETTADRISMEQIFSNLLGNALNYLDADRPGEIKITADSRIDETVFHVRDNGCGIKKSDLNKVFNIFERLNKNSVAGEGMGLAYVQALVRRQQGEVYCESEYGVGSEFTFTLPKRLNPHEDIEAD